jgi:hypothetical protein
MSGLTSERELVGYWTEGLSAWGIYAVWQNVKKVLKSTVTTTNWYTDHETYRVEF